MKSTQRTTKFLFNSLKNGDFLGFYAKKWWHAFAKLIFIITGHKLSHIAGVFDVVRDDSSITFKVGEQDVSDGRRVNTYYIRKSLEGYLIDSRFRDNKKDFYLLSNHFNISEAKNKKLSKFWNTEDDYNLAELAMTQNWFFRIFGKKDKVYDGVCSTAADQSMRLIGIEDAKFDDKAKNPTEFARSSFIKSISKINGDT